MVSLNVRQLNVRWCTLDLLHIMGTYSGDTEVFKLSSLQFPNKSDVMCFLETKFECKVTVKRNLTWDMRMNIYVKFLSRFLNNSLILRLFSRMKRGNASSEKYGKSNNTLLFI